MSNQQIPAYQLTSHPVGTLREIWAVSWPLMLGLLSSSLMFFSDRLFLAHHSVASLNAAASSSMAVYLFIILPLAISEITQVFVGRFHGEEKFQQVGKPVWQMLWFSIILAPLFFIVPGLLAPLLFRGTEISHLECDYFASLAIFGPFMMASIALMGFFIGIGQMKAVAYCTGLANVFNIVLDAVLIFGTPYSPAYGIKGAAIATGIAHFFQVLFFLVLFLQKKYREKYGTHSWRFDRTLFLDCMKVGTPAGFARAVELFAHCVFFRIMIAAGQEQMTIVTLVQSFFVFTSFMVDGLSKGVTAVVSNLIGAKRVSHIKGVIRSGFILHGIFFTILAIFCIVAFQPIIGAILSENDQLLLQNSAFMYSLIAAMFWMLLFFLFDGFSWVLMGQLTAARDTAFIFRTSLVMNWLAYILPVYYFVSIEGKGADFAWFLLALCNMSIYAIYYWRYRSGKWQRSIDDKDLMLDPAVN